MDANFVDIEDLPAEAACSNCEYQYCQGHCSLHDSSLEGIDGPCTDWDRLLED